MSETPLGIKSCGAKKVLLFVICFIFYVVHSKLVVSPKLATNVSACDVTESRRA
jgi:hypothetical protein